MQPFSFAVCLHKLGNVVITAFFFADDLLQVLQLSRTPKRGMNKLLRIVSRFCMDMHMKLATSKTYILTNAPNEIFWTQVFRCDNPSAR